MRLVKRTVSRVKIVRKASPSVMHDTEIVGQCAVFVQGVPVAVELVSRYRGELWSMNVADARLLIVAVFQCPVKWRQKKRCTVFWNVCFKMVYMRTYCRCI